MPDRNEAGKVFVGGLSWETTKDSLLAYFSQYGEVIDCVVMKNQMTGKSRGFGFVTYRDVSCVQTVLSVPNHILDGRQVDPKACNPKGLQQRQGEQGPPGQPGPGPQRQNRGPPRGQDAFKDKKIFIGGLPNSVDENYLKSFFSKYGRVIDLSIMYDQVENRSRGFGFLTLETDEAVDQLCRERFVNINGRKVECKRAEPRSRPEEPKEVHQIQLPGLPAVQHVEVPAPPPQQIQGPPEGQWPPPDNNWAPGGQVPPASVAAPPQYQNIPPFQGGYQEQQPGLQPAGWPPQQQPPPQGAGSWPPAGPPPGQQPPPGSSPFVGQPPATQIYTSPQAQAPTSAPAYQWSSPPGQVPPGSGQPPQAVAVGQAPQGAYGAYVPVSAPPQTPPTVTGQVRQYGEFPTNGQPQVAPAPGSQLPASTPQTFPGYPSPYGAPVTQAASTTPAPDPYAQPTVVPTPGAALQIPGVPASAQPQAVPGYGSPVTPAGAVGAVPDPATAGTVKPADYASYYGTYGAASQYGSVDSTGYSTGVSTSHIPTGVPPAFPQGGASFTSPVTAQVPSSVTGYTGDATAAAAAYGATQPAQNPYGSPTEAPQPVAYGGAPGPAPTFQRQGSASQTYHPYRR